MKNLKKDLNSIIEESIGEKFSKRWIVFKFHLYLLRIKLFINGEL